MTWEEAKEIRAYKAGGTWVSERELQHADYVLSNGAFGIDMYQHTKNKKVNENDNVSPEGSN